MVKVIYIHKNKYIAINNHFTVQSTKGPNLRSSIYVTI